MIVVDTTVLVYAVGGDHPLRQPSREIVTAIGEGRLAATTTIEAIQEFTEVRARRLSRRQAVETARDYATLLAPLARPDGADLERGLAIFAEVPNLSCFNAVLASLVLNSERLTGLVSADSAFAEVEGLNAVDLGSPDLQQRLGIV